MMRRIVVKVGTAMLSDQTSALSPRRIRQVADDIAALCQERRQVVLVSSGAVGAGMALLGFARRPRRLTDLQAAAAVGQHHLMQRYEQALRRHRVVPAQILLTRDDLHDRVRYLNARNTLLELWARKILPIINENDTVATEEIRFGDNDRLSAVVAILLDADLLVILSNVEGCYDEAGRLISRIAEFTEAIHRAATAQAGVATSVGGMATKLQAAQMTTRAGIPCVIASGLRRGVLQAAARGEAVGTYCVPRAIGLEGRKRWVAFAAKPRGRIVVDDGAKGAVTARGRSLLASGVVESHGHFAVGDPVAVDDRHGQEFARGLVNYSSEDLARIKGLRSAQIEAVLGSKTFDEVIHRNNLVVL